MIETSMGSQVSGDDPVRGVNITRAITEESPTTGVNGSLLAAQAKVVLCACVCVCARVSYVSVRAASSETSEPRNLVEMMLQGMLCSWR